MKRKNQAFFSYNNKNCAHKFFQYKDFEKTNSYHSSFFEASFQGTSFRGAKFKYCNFTGGKFDQTEFIGTNLRGCNFSRAQFADCIFVNPILEKANFKDAVFHDCYLIGSVKSSRNFPECDSELTIMNCCPPQDSVSSQLYMIIENLRKFDYIRRSRTLHCKNGKINTLSIMVLEKDFTEEELIHYLPLLPAVVQTDFYTLSYLKMLLKKIKRMDSI